MDNQRKIIINVGRQIGSGGRNVAQLLAKEFGAQLFDNELLTLAASESGFAPEFFERNDEQKGFLRSLFNLHLTGNGSGSSFYQSNFSQEGLFKFQSDAIRKAAEKDTSCVFVGRCADYVLRDRTDCFNVFITAPMLFRIEHVAERHKCTPEEARRIIEKGEAERANYYNYYTGRHWGAADGYHLCVDSSLLGIDGTASFIANFIRNYLDKQE